MRQQAAQVYFPTPLYFEIKQIAKKEGKSMAAWVRDLVSEEVQKKASKRKKLTDLPTFSWGTETDLSERVDEIVYDLP